VHGDIESVLGNIHSDVVCHPDLLCGPRAPTCDNPNWNVSATIRAIDPQNEPVTPLSFDLIDPNQIGLPVRKPVNIKHRAGGVIQVTKRNPPRSLRRSHTSLAVPCAPRGGRALA
jgi:hypothetical protein